MAKRVLILGGGGMLGHKLAQVLAEGFDVYATVRQTSQAYVRHELFDPSRLLSHVSAQDTDSILRAIERARPEVIVNCVGIVKQDAAAKDPLTSISINALFPHKLAGICRAASIRLVHLSTDCVFSGRKGNYDENDVSDAEDLYGRTKFLGEVSGELCLTLRTSMIGRELQGAHGLVEWFLSQEGKTVRGFRRAVFSGFTTLELARIVAKVIDERPAMHGVWHVAAEPINKFDLLSLIKEVYGLKVKIEPDESFVCDRSLNAGRFWQTVNSAPKPWPQMIEEMQKDSTPYAEIRRNNAHG
ncbi:MAG: NAD(P)-dependent oxidoreductase [Acidobacteria bacterium]|nr:MAG: NAD(P)-dependent oxidoreductase [Acidobacteriota bacterium]